MKQIDWMILAISMMGVLLIFSCRNKEDDLLEKSFISIQGVKEVEITRNSANIFFTLSGISLLDSIKRKRLQYFNSKFPSIIKELPIGLDSNNVVVDGLEPGNTYCYKIIIETSLDESPYNQFIFPDSTDQSKCFDTPKFNVFVDDKVEESETDYKLTAIGFFKNFNASDAVGLEYGHIWTVRDIDENIILSDTINSTEEINFNGVFTTELKNFEIGVTYQIEAFYRPNGINNIFPSQDKTIHEIVSQGDFWVNLKPENNGYTGPVREGAVSFVIKERDGKEYAYMGLGKNGDTYHLDFWRYDPYENSWEVVCDPCGGGDNEKYKRAYAVSFVLEDSTKAYIGTGCYPCPNSEEDIGNIGLKDDFFIFNSDNGSFSNFIFSLNNGGEDEDRDIKETIEADEDDEARFAAYAFVENNTAYIGGGLGKRVKKSNNPIPDCEEVLEMNEGEWIDLNGDNIVNELVDCKENKNTEWAIVRDFNRGEWSDEDRDNKFDRGEWDDEDGNNKFDRGEWDDKNENNKFELHLKEWVEEVDDENPDIFDQGEWTDNLTSVDADSMFNPGEWRDIIMENDSLDLGDWMDANHNDSLDLIKEWKDNNGNGYVDNDEVELEFSTRRDIWMHNSDGTTFKANTNQGIRYGALVFYTDNFYIIGGEKVSETNVEDTIFQWNNQGIWTSQLGIMNQKPKRFGIQFLLNNKLYVGGGEEVINGEFGFFKKEPTALILTEYTMPNNGNFTKSESVARCGIGGLSRGISFSINGQFGYIGFGLTGIGKSAEIKKEFWMYVPSKD